LAVTGARDPDRHLEGDWSFHRCYSCGIFWLDPAPLPHEMWKAYVTYHTHSQKLDGRLRRLMLSLAHRFIRLTWLPSAIASGLKCEADGLRFMTLETEKSGRLLDVGCGGGRFLKRMQKRGWQVVGTDFDLQAARKVSARYGIETHVGDLQHCNLPASSFDVITLSQTIEHLYTPIATLRECLRLMKPGGLLVMTTPNAASLGAKKFGSSWRGWEAPRHLQLFTVQSLKTLTQQAGFAVEEARTISSGSAVVYRASRDIADGSSGSLWHRFQTMSWGYEMELQEQRKQLTQPLSGQNILIRARKP